MFIQSVQNGTAAPKRRTWLASVGAFLGCALAACAPGGSATPAAAPEQASGPKPLSEAAALVFELAPGSPGSAGPFEESVVARFGKAYSAQQISDDLAAQGFECEDMRAASAGPDDPLVRCSRVVLVDQCADLYSVDVLRGAGPDEEHAEIAPFSIKRCMGVIPNDPLMEPPPPEPETPPPQ